MAVGPFEINGVRDWIDPIVRVCFVGDFEGHNYNLLIDCNSRYFKCAPY
jgi:hypothetical protein